MEGVRLEVAGLSRTTKARSRGALGAEECGGGGGGFRPGVTRSLKAFFLGLGLNSLRASTYVSQRQQAPPGVQMTPSPREMFPFLSSRSTHWKGPPGMKVGFC